MHCWNGCSGGHVTRDTHQVLAERDGQRAGVARDLICQGQRLREHFCLRQDVVEQPGRFGLGVGREEDAASEDQLLGSAGPDQPGQKPA